MSRLFWWVGYNALLTYALYAGLINGSEGWGNIVVAYAVFVFITGMLLLTETARKELVKDASVRMVMPMNVNVVLALLYTGVMVFHGWFWMGLLFFVGRSGALIAIHDAVKTRQRWGVR